MNKLLQIIKKNDNFLPTLFHKLGFDEEQRKKDKKTGRILDEPIPSNKVDKLYLDTYYHIKEARIKELEVLVEMIKEREYLDIKKLLQDTIKELRDAR